MPTSCRGIPASTTSIAIILCLEAELSQVWGAQGKKRRDETATFHGGITVLRPGKGEAIAVEAMLQAFALLAEIEDQLRADHTAGTQYVVKAELRPTRMQPLILPSGRVFDLSFDILMEAQLPRIAGG
jgi:hypothetical protein